jgi:uncharacterized integral membrane protein
VPVAVLVIAFAVANRQYVTLSLDPLTPSDPFASIQLPLWLLFFLGLLGGAVIGWITCWFAQGKYRKRARDAQSEILRLQHERDALARAKADEAAPDQHIVPLGSGWV